MNILLLTPTDIEDRTFGAAKRSNDLRAALMKNHAVDTLQIHGGWKFRLDATWDANRVRQATPRGFGLSPKALLDRRAVRRWVSQIVEEGGYQAIVTRYIGMARFVSKQHRHLMIIDGDDLAKTPPTGLFARAKAHARRIATLRIADAARHVWIVNPRDAKLLKNADTSMLANAIRVPPRRTRPVLLMVGLFEYQPNIDGIEWFIGNVLPLLVEQYPTIELHVVGRHRPGFLADAPSAVKVLGYVDDLEVEYDRAAIVIAPIVAGGGTQIKVIEALAQARPIVCSPFAHAGFAQDLVEYEHLLIADTPAEWLKQCSWVLENAAAAQAMADRGYLVAAATFDVRNFEAAITKTLDEWEKR